MSRRHSQATEYQVGLLLDQRKTHRWIADKLGISKTAVAAIAGRRKPRPRAPAIVAAPAPVIVAPVEVQSPEELTTVDGFSALERAPAGVLEAFLEPAGLAAFTVELEGCFEPGLEGAPARALVLLEAAAAIVRQS
jgi:hypothetical protein